MAKKRSGEALTGLESLAAPVVAAILAGVIYHARLLNRQAKLNIPEEEVVSDVLSMWQNVRGRLTGESR